MSEKYIARSSAVAERELGGEMVIMTAADSTLFSLSEVATLIWQAADGRTPLSEIVERRVCEEFDVPLDTAYRDAEAFVEELSSHGILRVFDHPVSDPPSDQPVAGAEPEPEEAP
jgi:coenzyme PQQ synthesis protein D (PqqD)